MAVAKGSFGLPINLIALTCKNNIFDHFKKNFIVSICFALNCFTSNSTRKQWSFATMIELCLSHRPLERTHLKV